MDSMEGIATTLAAGDVFVLTADQPMSSEHAARLKEFVSAALPEGVRVLVLDPGYKFDVLPRPVGVSRIGDNDRALLVHFRGMPSDDAIRGLHDLLNGSPPARSAIAPLTGAELWEIMFGIFKGDVPELLTDDRLEEIAAAIRQAFGSDSARAKAPDTTMTVEIKGAEIMELAAAEIGDVRESFNNAIEFALTGISDGTGLGFLDLWTHGDFAAIARDYPDFKFKSERPLPPVTYHVTEEGEPWALYREGAFPPECITRQEAIDAMNLYGSGDGDEWAADNPELPTVTVFYVTGERPEPNKVSKPRRRKQRPPLGFNPHSGAESGGMDDDDDEPPLDDLGVWFCDAGEPGAYPVTGFKFG